MSPALEGRASGSFRRPNSGLEQALSRKVVVCVGSGGVGKTTISASLALQAAALGKKVLVCTIDPARRLANSMGLEALDNAEKRVPAEAFTAAGLQVKGELWAMMLDLQRSWDEVIERYAPTPERKKQILENRFYVQLSTALAGSHEYVAMEKLHALHQRGGYDLIVLDTPPTRNALDFLDAPDRVIGFLDNEAARWLMDPAATAGRAGLKLFATGSQVAAKVLARFTGEGTLEELAKFLSALGGMYEGFTRRAAEMKALFASDAATFVLVSSPSSMKVEEALFFHQTLTRQRMAMAAVVANRVSPDLLKGQTVNREAIEAAAATLHTAPIPGLPPLGTRLWDTLEDEQLLARLDSAQLDKLAAAIGPLALHRIPKLDQDVHDLRTLWEIGRHLFPASLT